MSKSTCVIELRVASQALPTEAGPKVDFSGRYRQQCSTESNNDEATAVYYMVNAEIRKALPVDPIKLLSKAAFRHVLKSRQMSANVAPGINFFRSSRKCPSELM